MTRMMLGWLLVLAALPLPAQKTVNVMTYNIRLNTPGDGEHAWPHRKQDVLSTIRFHEADIFCLQEVLHDQMLDVQSAFPDYGYVGVGRDDGINAGEYSPVYFDKSRFRKEDSGNFWLSDTPGKPSLGWDAACIRICSWVQLEEKLTGKGFFVFNTHFDHVGTKARINAAKLIMEKIQELAGDEVVILCGDFNLPPEAAPIKMISSKLNDSYHTSNIRPHGSKATYLGFTYDSKAGSRIDYIFVSRGVEIERYGALTDSHDRKFFSDHLPVLVELSFE